MLRGHYSKELERRIMQTVMGTGSELTLARSSSLAFDTEAAMLPTVGDILSDVLGSGRR